MTKDQQYEFLRGLMAAVFEDVVKKLRAGQVPENWDGHELRVLLAKKFNDSATMSEIYREPRCKRARDFKSVMLTSNL